MSTITLDQNMESAREEHIIPGRELHLKDMRPYRFCEIGPVTGTSKENAVINIYNTAGANNPTPEEFAALDADALAKETGSLQVWLNPPGITCTTHLMSSRSERSGPSTGSRPPGSRSWGPKRH